MTIETARHCFRILFAGCCLGLALAGIVELPLAIAAALVIA